MNEQPNDPQAGKSLGTVGRYALRRELASGGMATVYLASLTGPHGFEKVVAVKRIHPHLKKDRRFVEMFLDEARVAALIHHPNVCAVADFGEEDGTPYLVMEFLQGESLSSVLRAARAEGGVPFWLAARIVHDAARGLHAAHELRGPDGHPLGVVHRDVSPQNIFVLYDGLTKVVDFGVARARGRLTVTGTNEVKGKLPYMSPEQYDGENVDRRTDVWALGVVLWETTVGRRLFRADNDGATIARVLHKPVPRPSEVRTDYPPELEAIVMRCLERDVTLRYPSAEALAEDLETFMYSLGKPAGASQVKRWMHEHFASHIERGEALLRGESAEEGLEEPSGTTLSSIRARADHAIGPSDPTVVWPPGTTDGPSVGAQAPTVSGDAATVVARQLAPGGSHPDIPAFPSAADADADESDEDARHIVAHRRKRALVLSLLAALVAVGVALVAHPRPDVAVETRDEVVAPPSIGAPSPEPAASDRDTARATPSAMEPPTAALPAEPTAPVPPGPRAAAARPGAVPATPTPGPSPEPAQAAAPAPVAVPEPPRPRAPEPAAPAEPTAPGTLSLLAIPPATVRLGGRVLGETPLARLELPAGDHRLELTTADGRSQVVTVHIESGTATRRRVEFPTPAAP
ncbi:MAG: serine/threonine-protein kinase [Polyangiales bacterium]